MGKQSHQDYMKMSGQLEIKHIRAGKLLETYNIRNLVVNAGKAAVADLILSDNPGGTAAFDYIAIGTGNTAASATDTALVAEISTGGGARAAATGTRVTTSVTNDTAQLVLTYTFTSSFAVVETGIFNAASAGSMLARQVFSTINVQNGDQLTMTWKVQVS